MHKAANLQLSMWNLHTDRCYPYMRTVFTRAIIWLSAHAMPHTSCLSNNKASICYQLCHILIRRSTIWMTDEKQIFWYTSTS